MKITPRIITRIPLRSSPRRNASEWWTSGTAQPGSALRNGQSFGLWNSGWSDTSDTELGRRGEPRELRMQLNRALKALFIEAGREVSESEAFGLVP